MKLSFILLLVGLFLGCGHQRAPSTVSTPNEAIETTDLKMIKEKTILELSLVPGEVKKVILPKSATHKASSFLCEGVSVPIYDDGNQIIFFLRESYFSPMKPYQCRLAYDDQEELLIKVKINSVVYETEHLTVDPGTVTPSPENQARIAKEQLMLNKLYAGFSMTPLSFEPFVRPLPSILTSTYGRRRVFNGQQKGQHLGVDFRAAVGTPVFVSNRGRIAFSGDLFYTGGTVIVDHGLGVFTIYAHLSTMSVKAGDIVERSAQIGLSGKTGRVSGPHLHWGVKVHGQFVDGLRLISTSESPSMVATN